MDTHGFPVLGAVEGRLKIDRELEQLREAMSAELDLVDARLNDGVGENIAEVHELVSAVSTIRTDLERLREFGMYISGSGRLISSSEDGNIDFMLAKYPWLKSMINAHRNLLR